MKTLQKLMCLSIATLAIVCISFNTATSQDYLGKNEAIENLVDENVALAAVLPGLPHASSEYLMTKEKIRVIKQMLGFLKVGKSVQQAAQLSLPVGESNQYRYYVKPFDTGNGKASTDWALEEILPLITE